MKQFAIVFPCFNEEKIIPLFLEQLNCIVASYAGVHQFDLIMVDDASLDETILAAENYKKNNPGLSLTILSLGYNMGHQEAIRQGLQFVAAAKKTYNGIIVMDSDGEDNPNAIAKLIVEEHFDIIFVERGKRKASFMFRLGYFIYQYLFRLVTGKKINFGNYSMISNRVLISISRQRFFHYSGFLNKSKYDIKRIRFDRLARIDGKSKMSFKGLVFHGLYSLVEYSEEILLTLIKGFVLILFMLIGTGVYVLYSKYIAKTTPYGWTSTITVNLLISLLIIISTIIICLLQISIKRSINQSDSEYKVI